MQKLEDFMRDNKSEFDDFEPSAKVWENIETTLKKHDAKKIKLWPLGAIAAILLVALMTTVTLKPSEHAIIESAQTVNPEMKELLETEAFYSSKVNVKLAEIRNCYQLFPELKSEIESDLSDLDNMYKELVNDLNENAYNKEVIEAMIQNNRLKLELVDRVLNQINC